MIQQMPNSIEAEQALLGAMLIYPSSVRTAFEQGIRKEDFYMESHQLVFHAMSLLHEVGKPIDATGLCSKLTDLNCLKQVGGAEYIMQLADATVTSANTKYYTEIIQDKSYMRSLILTAQQIAQEGFDSTNDIDDLMDQAEKQILDVTRSRRTSEFKSSEEIIAEVLENIHKMSNNKSSITGMKTGYRDLDNTTNGLQKGDLIILAARPSMGKTAFALNVGMQVAMHNDLPCAIFSLEMPAEQLMMRMLSAKSQIKGSQLRTGYLMNKEWNQLNEAATDLKQTKIFIDDSPGIKTAEIFSKCRKLQAEHGLGVIVIDYIQLISSSSKKTDNRQQEVSDISRNLKALARELKVPVIALSQLSRSVEQRENKRPMLSDLRESGALEQDADLVVFLYRDEYYQKYKQTEDVVEKSDDDLEKMEVNIAKHRNGPTRTIELAFKRSINAFYDYEGSGVENE